MSQNHQHLPKTVGLSEWSTPDKPERTFVNAATTTGSGLYSRETWIRPANQEQIFAHIKQLMENLNSIDDVEIEASISTFRTIQIFGGQTFLVGGKRIFVQVSWQERSSEIDQIIEIQQLGNKIFSRPETYWSPEARIAYRFNSNEKVIAELRGKRYDNISIQDVKDRIIKEKGDNIWKRLIQSEKERRAADIWQEEREV